MQITFTPVMSSFRLPLLPAFCLAAVSLFGPGSLRADATADFASFLKKFPPPKNASTPGGDYQRSALSQFQLLDSAIKRGDYDRALEMMQNLGGYGVPPEMQADWAVLSDALATELQKLKLDAAIKWKKQVDDLARQTRQACLAAKTSDDLDTVLIACTALQLKRQGQNGILIQTANQTLENINQTLQYWSDFWMPATPEIPSRPTTSCAT